MRSARFAGSGAGILLLLLGVSGALIPFVGPYVHYGFRPDATWYYTNDRLRLDIAPVAAVALGGLRLITAADSGRGMIGGWLAFIGGSWFLVGSALSALWTTSISGLGSSAIGAPLGSPHRAAWEMVGFFYGLGALTVAIAALAVGVIAAAPSYVSEPAMVGIDESGAPTEPVVVRR